MTDPPPIRLVVADDHVVVRESLCKLISTQSDMEIIGQASDAPSTVELVRETNPLVVLLDMWMPRGGGMYVLEALSGDNTTRTLVLSGHHDGDLPARILSTGGRGYLTKAVRSDELFRAIRAVAAGRVYFNAPVADLGVPDSSLADTLSAREREVVVQVALGHTSKEIAADLDLARTTVEVYRSRAMKKLGVKTRADLVRYALDTGLIGRLGSS